MEFFSIPAMIPTDISHVNDDINLFLGKYDPNYLISYPLNTESMENKVAVWIRKSWKDLVLAICWCISYASHLKEIGMCANVPFRGNNAMFKNGHTHSERFPSSS